MARNGASRCDCDEVLTPRLFCGGALSGNLSANETFSIVACKHVEVAEDRSHLTGCIKTGDGLPIRIDDLL